MGILGSMTERLTVGTPATSGALTMYPLTDGSGIRPDTDYVDLEDAMKKGHLQITEVSREGSVPRVKVANNGVAPVLILDGEEIVGAKQNRTINLTILVPPKTTIEVPVACVEAGRWAPQSSSFSSSGRTHFASGRASKLESVSERMRQTGSREADQARVWDDVALKLDSMHASSPTRAASAVFESTGSQLEMFRKELAPVDGQVGALFAVHGAIAGMDLFETEPSLRKQLPKLIRSFGVEALDIEEKPLSVPPIDPASFLLALTRAPGERFPAIGLGEDVRIESEEVAAAALLVGDRLIHLVAFPRNRWKTPRGRGRRRSSGWIL